MCNSIKQIYLPNYVSTHSQTLADHIQIYPNPIQNRRFRIQTDDALQIEHIELFNALGQRVLLEQNKRDIPTQEIEIPPLPTGIYSLLLQTDKGLATKKILID